MENSGPGWSAAASELGAIQELARQLPHLWRDWSRFAVAHGQVALYRAGVLAPARLALAVTELEARIEALTSAAVRWALLEEHPFAVNVKAAQAFVQWEAARKVLFDVRQAGAASASADELQKRWRMKCAAWLGRAARLLDGAEDIVAVVDDETIVATSLARTLRAQDFEVSIYDSCKSFLEQAGTSSWGCVLVDLTSPPADGSDLVALLGENGNFPVVTMSGLASNDLEARAVSLGASTRLRKPGDPEALILAVSGAMCRHSRR